MINKKFKPQITQTHGEGLSKLLLQVIFSNHLDFKIGQWKFFRTRGPGSSKTFELHYLAVVRQVHSCSYLLIIFKRIN
jgi:hypothetical protein